MKLHVCIQKQSMNDMPVNKKNKKKIKRGKGI